MRIAINGFGRTGRTAFRIAVDEQEHGLEVVHVNDVADARTLAHLLKYDTTHGVWDRDVRADEDALLVDDRRIPISSESDPGRLPWKDREVQIVFESSGKFRERDDAARHVRAGADKVLISAPGKSPLDGDFVLGVNDADYDPDEHDIVSLGSCTTNCLAPVAKVLHDEFGIEGGLMTTVHAYTASQNLLDGPHKDLRRARAAADSIIPTTTGAAAAIGKILPELDGKLDGMAIRVPVACGSITDFTCVVAKDTSVDAVNDAFTRRAAGPMAGILAVADSPLVSADIVGDPHSAVVVPEDTKVQGRIVKVLAWYDNETAFSRRCVEMMSRMIES